MMKDPVLPPEGPVGNNGGKQEVSQVLNRIWTIAALAFGLVILLAVMPRAPDLAEGKQPAAIEAAATGTVELYNLNLEATAIGSTIGTGLVMESYCVDIADLKEGNAAPAAGPRPGVAALPTASILMYEEEKGMCRDDEGSVFFATGTLTDAVHRPTFVIEPEPTLLL